MSGADSRETNRKRVCSLCFRELPKRSSVRFDKFLRKVSYTSRQSCSNAACRSTSLTKKQSNHDRRTSSGSTEETTHLCTDHSASNRGEKDKNIRHWLCCEESLPVSMLHPEHQSCLVRNCQYSSLVREGGTQPRHAVVPDQDLSAEDGDRVIFQPGELHTPIVGFDTMESRSKFTVYKIQVQKTTSNSSWFIFRRYSDFLHLNQTLKRHFPEFQVSLPPKRWFRDNFESNFLEERKLGLQRFLNIIMIDEEVCNSAPVQSFLCTDDPPGPCDTLEESRALCDRLEGYMRTLRRRLDERDSELASLREKVKQYKSQVEFLSSQLRERRGNIQYKDGTA